MAGWRERFQEIGRRHAEKLQEQTIAEIIDGTFGPNPCERLVLRSELTGESFSKLCDSKRCPNCGPRKQAILWLGLQEAYGEIAWIGRVDAAESDLIGNRARQRRKRGETVEYLSIEGDAPGERLLISGVKISDSQRRMELAPWKARILNLYHRGASAIRRTKRGIASRVTLSPKRTRAKRDNGWGVVPKRSIRAEQWAAGQADLHEERRIQHESWVDWRLEEDQLVLV